MDASNLKPPTISQPAIIVAFNEHRFTDAEILLEQDKASINARDEGQSIAAFIVLCNNVEAVDVFIRQNLVLNRFEYCSTLYHLACAHGAIDIIEHLHKTLPKSDWNSLLDIKDDNGRTGMEVASMLLEIAHDENRADEYMKWNVEAYYWPIDDKDETVENNISRSVEAVINFIEQLE